MTSRPRALELAALSLLVATSAACDRVLGFEDDYRLADEDAAAGERVTSLSLIDAAVDQPVPGHDPLLDGAIIDPVALGTSQLNLRANTSPELVGSVRFGLGDEGSYQLENEAPYAIATDLNGDYRPWTLAAGTHRITATAFTAPNAGGQASQPVIVNIELLAPIGP